MLFHGLEAGKLLGPIGFVPRPVIRLDMNGPAGSTSKELLEGNIKIVLEGNAARHGIELKGVDSKSSFFSLMEEVAKRSPTIKPSS